MSRDPEKSHSDGETDQEVLEGRDQTLAPISPSPQPCLPSPDCSFRVALGSIRSKEPACQCRRHKRLGLHPWVGKMPWRRAWQPTPVFLPGESHGQRSLVGYSPWGQKELGMTEAP